MQVINKQMGIEKLEAQRKALFDLVDLYSDKAPDLMVPHVTYVVLKEAVRLLREDNESLRAQIAELKPQE